MSLCRFGLWLFFFFFNQFGSVVLGVNIFVFILLGIHLTSQVCGFMIFIKLRTFLHGFFESFSASFSLSFLMTHSACLFILMIFSVKFYSLFFEIIFPYFLDLMIFVNISSNSSDSPASLLICLVTFSFQLLYFLNSGFHFSRFFFIISVPLLKNLFYSLLVSFH